MQSDWDGLGEAKKRKRQESAIHNIGRTLKRILAFKGTELGQIIAGRGILSPEKVLESQKIVMVSSEQSKYSFKDLVTSSADLHIILYIIASLIILTKKNYSSYLVTNRCLRDAGLMGEFAVKVQETIEKLCTTDVWIAARKFCEARLADEDQPLPPPPDEELPTHVLGLLSFRNGNYYIDCVVPLTALTLKAAQDGLRELLDKRSKSPAVG